MEDQLDQCMPEITKLCVHLQTAYNQLQSLLTQTDQDEAADLQEFIVLQLLMLAKVRERTARPKAPWTAKRSTDARVRVGERVTIDARLLGRSRPSAHAGTLP